jgi:hypothetical protein
MNIEERNAEIVRRAKNGDRYRAIGSTVGLSVPRVCEIARAAGVDNAHRRSQAMGANPSWQGGTSRSNGYIVAKAPGHPRSSSSGYVLAHVLVVEAVLGKPLDPKHPIHHVDQNRANNHPTNLVVCEDQAYHLLLHRRKRALEECGHADWLRCPYCKTHDDPANMYVRPNGSGGHHRACVNRVQRERGR